MKVDAGIEFRDTIIDFGMLEFEGDAHVEFHFTSAGEAPLLVTHVKSTCGCTVAEWSDEPVSPGETGRILVSYDTHRIGRFTKTIYVYSNAIEGVRKLQIRGEVSRPVASDKS